MGRPPIKVNLEKLEMLAAMRRTPGEIAKALGLSRAEFGLRRCGHGEDAEFRRRYFAGREKSKQEAMGHVDIILRALDSETVRDFLAAMIARPILVNRDRAFMARPLAAVDELPGQGGAA